MDLKDHLFPPPCSEQGHLPLAQGVQSPMVQPGQPWSQGLPGPPQLQAAALETEVPAPRDSPRAGGVYPDDGPFRQQMAQVGQEITAQRGLS